MEQKEMVRTLTKVLKTSTVLENEPMRKHTTFRIGGNADIYIKLNNEEEIKDLLKLVKAYDVPLTILGNGSNVLVTDKGIRGIVIETNIKGIDFVEKDEKSMETDVYALTDFSPRKGENISKGYLQGRYGAIPFIGGEVPWEE